MILLAKRLNAFERLGQVLKNDAKSITSSENEALLAFQSAKQKAKSKNTWFTDDNITLMVENIAAMISTEQLEKFSEAYELEKITKPKTVAVIMAGNIPLVGFHDFFVVLATGHKFLGKLSSDDLYLLPALADVLITIEPEFKPYIAFAEGTIAGFDAVIATGSNNTARYFNYYFGKYPHLIRANRNGVAVIDGTETKEELQVLGLDVFSYFGLGCRNISTLFVPDGYDFKPMFEAFEMFNDLNNHSKYFNNYEYNKAIWLVNGDVHFDNGFMLLKKAAEFSSPVSVLHYQTYNDTKMLQELLTDNAEKIQCIVSRKAHWTNSYAFGKAQSPTILDYADGIDSTTFLLEL